MVAPALGVDVYEVRTNVGLLGLDVDIVEMNVTGVAHEETLGRKVSPHGGFRIFFFFLVGYGIVDEFQVFRLYSALMPDSDVRQPHVTDGIARQTSYRTARGPGVVYLDVIYPYTVDTPNMVNGNQVRYRIVITFSA